MRRGVEIPAGVKDLTFTCEVSGANPPDVHFIEVDKLKLTPTALVNGAADPVLLATFARVGDTELSASAADRVALLAALRGGYQLIGFEIGANRRRGTFPTFGLPAAGGISLSFGYAPDSANAMPTSLGLYVDDTPGALACSIYGDMNFDAGATARMWGIL